MLFADGVCGEIGIRPLRAVVFGLRDFHVIEVESFLDELATFAPLSQASAELLADDGSLELKLAAGIPLLGNSRPHSHFKRAEKRSFIVPLFADAVPESVSHWHLAGESTAFVPFTDQAVDFAAHERHFLVRTPIVVIGSLDVRLHFGFCHSRRVVPNRCPSIGTSSVKAKFTL